MPIAMQLKAVKSDLSHVQQADALYCILRRTTVSNIPAVLQAIRSCLSAHARDASPVAKQDPVDDNASEPSAKKIKEEPENEDDKEEGEIVDEVDDTGISYLDDREILNLHQMTKLPHDLQDTLASNVLNIFVEAVSQTEERLFFEPVSLHGILLLLTLRLLRQWQPVASIASCAMQPIEFLQTIESLSFIDKRYTQSPHSRNDLLVSFENAAQELVNMRFERVRRRQQRTRTPIFRAVLTYHLLYAHCARQHVAATYCRQPRIVRCHKRRLSFTPRDAVPVTAPDALGQLASLRQLFEKCQQSRCAPLFRAFDSLLVDQVNRPENEIGMLVRVDELLLNAAGCDPSSEAVVSWLRQPHLPLEELHRLILLALLDDKSSPSWRSTIEDLLAMLLSTSEWDSASCQRSISCDNEALLIPVTFENAAVLCLQLLTRFLRHAQSSVTLYCVLLQGDVTEPLTNEIPNDCAEQLRVQWGNSDSRTQLMTWMRDGFVFEMGLLTIIASFAEEGDNEFQTILENSLAVNAECSSKKATLRKMCLFAKQNLELIFNTCK